MPEPTLTQDQIMALYLHHESGTSSAFYDPRGLALGYLSAYVIEDEATSDQLIIITEISNAIKYKCSTDGVVLGGSLCYRRTRWDSGDGWNDWVLVPAMLR
ncbi:hypothetical protein GTP46_27640 [Duganella sp. FT135W]|uniref:Uncharacterized protein n=1 Tax=Duganella flavida TaxID=2692175 RepID=A0A6L8KI31_9BURK|nr:hypothetical protein [Duganella flavida]MYM26407.1 hypothetical protein [Duganella flavida]